MLVLSSCSGETEDTAHPDSRRGSCSRIDGSNHKLTYYVTHISISRKNLVRFDVGGHAIELAKSGYGLLLEGRVV
jgi:hypothetical protein